MTWHSNYIKLSIVILLNAALMFFSSFCFAEDNPNGNLTPSTGAEEEYAANTLQDEVEKLALALPEKLPNELRAFLPSGAKGTSRKESLVLRCDTIIKENNVMPCIFEFLLQRIRTRYELTNMERVKLDASIEKNLIHLNEWFLVDVFLGNKDSSGWMLEAKKSNRTQNLFYHSRPILLLAQTEHYIFFKDTGVSHSSHRIIVVKIDQNPAVIYESPDWKPDKECGALLTSYCEKGGALHFQIKLYELRREDSHIMLHCTIRTNPI